MRQVLSLAQKSYSESPKSYSEKSYSEKSISHPRRLSSPIDKNTAVNISQKMFLFSAMIGNITHAVLAINHMIRS